MLLLTLFVVFKTSVTMFTHIHIVDGVIIVHSHPYADEHHTHSVEQIISIAQVASTQVLEPHAECNITVDCHVLHGESTVFVLSSAQTTDVCRPSLRAPPFCC